MLSPNPAKAGPAGGEVTFGSGNIAQSGSTYTITQASKNLSLNWQSFNVAPSETVNFVQPSASAIAVNRIYDINGSKILGQLNANGQVYLINPNGILFGQGAQVNVGGLVASTLDMSDANLNTSTRFLHGNGSGLIVNQGLINASRGGYVALLGNTVSNEGSITVQQGTVALGAGSAATLTFSDNSLVKMQIDQSLLNSLSENAGLIHADGGLVIMNAGTKDALLASVVNNSGVIEAHTVEDHNGIITLLGGMANGNVTVGGKLDASAPNGGNGGFIETSGAHVKIADNATITTAAPLGKTGTWLIDPYDYTIAASGGNITGSALGTSLGNNNVTIFSSQGSTGSSGDININDTVSWAANKLTLSAGHSINVNAMLNGSSTAKLALEYGQGTVALNNSGDYIVNSPINLPAGENFSTKLGSDGGIKSYSVITSLGIAGDASTAPTIATLQGIAASANLAGNYALGSNIDAAGTSVWNTSAGFTPIGTSTAAYSGLTSKEVYSGTFDGLGHTVSGLTINNTTAKTVGLFGTTAVGSIIRNIGLVGGSVKGLNDVGGLAGINYAVISNSYNTGSVTGTAADATFVGGLLGSNSNSNVTDCYTTGDVTGTTSVGGLIGSNKVTGPLVTNTYATGNVKGTTSVGGLMGTNVGDLSKSYATGNVTQIDGGAGIGGLIGTNSAALVTNVYATGNVLSLTAAAGLIGTHSGAMLSNSYATGKVTGTTVPGVLIGTNSGGFANIYYKTSNLIPATSEATPGLLATGLTDAGMLQKSSFVGFDFTYTWDIRENLSNPILRSLANYVTVTAADAATKVYDGITYHGGNGVTYSGTYKGILPGVLSYGGTSQGAVNANATAYTITPLQSTTNYQYIFTSVDGKLIINPKPLDLSALSITRPYNGSASDGAGSSYTLNGGGLVTGQNLAITGASTFNSKNVGATLNSFVSSSAVSNGSSGLVSNYSLSGAINVINGGITRLSSVAWVGGTIGSWFDSANWEGGAVPDLSNVATVTIPTGTSFSFNNSGSPVNVDTVNGTGTSMELQAGTLNVATDLHVATLAQTVGILNGAGNVSVSKSFSQVGSGTIAMTGNVSLTQLDEDLSVNSLSGKNVTLVAGDNINLGAITVTGKLALEYGLDDSANGNTHDYSISAPVNLPAGQNFSTKLGSNGIVKDYTVITSLGDRDDATPEHTEATLQGMAAISNLAGNFVLGANIDASATGTSNYNGSAGFVPIGSSVNNFKGYFDGLGHTITNLNFDIGATANAGLFGYTFGPTRIQNVGLTGGVMKGGAATGGLVGYNDSGLIRNSYNTGNVTGAAFTGGLVGQDISGNIVNSYTTGVIIGAAYTGGLLGGGTIVNVTSSYATGSVHGAAGTGGLVGAITTGTVTDSYATGKVLGGAGTGGLVGTSTGLITKSYATGVVTGRIEGNENNGGSASVGGLVGATTGEVNLSYATGSVYGADGVGGLVGATTALINNTYATGTVTGTTSIVGGLVGATTGLLQNSYATGIVISTASATTGALAGTATVAISNSFYDKDVNVGMKGIGAQSIAGGVTGMSTVNMKLQSNFTTALTSTLANATPVAPNWDFASTWIILPGSTPFFKALMKSLVITAKDLIGLCWRRYLFGDPHINTRWHIKLQLFWQWRDNIDWAEQCR